MRDIAIERLCDCWIVTEEEIWTGKESNTWRKEESEREKDCDSKIGRQKKQYQMNMDDFFGICVLMQSECTPRVIHHRLDPRELMTDKEFKHHFCFSKRTV